MWKRWMAVALLCMLPACAFAGVESVYLSEANGKLATVRYSFSGEVPEAVCTVLQKHGYGDARCLNGLALERLVLETPEGQENAWRMSDALVAVESGGVRTVLGLQWSEKPGISRLTDLGAMGIAWDAVQWRFADAGMHTVDYEWTIGERSYRLAVTGENLWYVKACGDVEWNPGMGCFLLDGAWLPTPWTGCLKCLGRLDAFPDTAEAARETALEAWGDCASGQMMTICANLRAEPTGTSESLGVYHASGVPAQRLGMVQGAWAPWYQVRVGETVGWCSSPYAQPVEDIAQLVQEPSPDPLPAAAVRREILLRTAPDGPACTKLEPGVRVQVLAECADGWLHVAVPGCALNRWISPDGVFGYLRSDEVE